MFRDFNPNCKPIQGKKNIKKVLEIEYRRGTFEVSRII